MILVMQLIYVHADSITDFWILVISEAIFRGRAFKFGTVGVLNKLINISQDFAMIAKL